MGYYNFGQFENLVATLLRDVRNFAYILCFHICKVKDFFIFCGGVDFVYNVFIIFLTITRKVGVNRPWFC
jgi:hypothetical protein